MKNRKQGHHLPKITIETDLRIPTETDHGRFVNLRCLLRSRQATEVNF